jgi:4-amino-4-deoxy-L-arabinose transferase-like glycosyltransferase
MNDAAVRHRERRAAAAILLGGAAAALYGLAALGAWFPTPFTPGAVEAARTLAATGTDPSGAFFPLFIHVRNALWLQPVPVYLMALALRVSAGAASAPALMSAAVAVIDVVLTYHVARVVLDRDRAAVIAAALLVLTPAHLFYGTTATPAIYATPFALLWLLALLRHLERRRPAGLFAAAAALGAGMYTTPEAVWTMAAYGALTLALLARADARPRVRLAPAGAGFVVALLPMLGWFILHPASYVDTMGRWALHPAYIRNPIEGLQAFFRYDVVARRVSLYWDFFSPRHLFLSAAAPGLQWMGGVLLWPMAILLPIGLYRSFTREPDSAGLALGCGLLLAPLASAAFDEPRAIAAALPMLPFAAILGADGIEALLDRRWRRRLRESHVQHSATASDRPQMPARR